MWKIMKIFVTVLILLISVCATAKDITAEGVACISQYKSHPMAKRVALLLAKREALENTIVKIQSETILENFELVKDRIMTKSNAVVKLKKTLSQSWIQDKEEGKCYKIIGLFEINDEIIKNNLEDLK